MNNFGVGRSVADGDGGRLAMAHAKEWAGNLVVVGEGADVVFRAGFEQVGRIAPAARADSWVKRRREIISAGP